MTSDKGGDFVKRVGSEASVDVLFALIMASQMLDKVEALLPEGDIRNGFVKLQQDAGFQYEKPDPAAIIPGSRTAELASSYEIVTNHRILNTISEVCAQISNNSKADDVIKKELQTLYSGVQEIIRGERAKSPLQIG